MQAEELFALGLGLTPPWKVMSQGPDTGHTPSRLPPEIGADRGALYPCPGCGSACKAHDFREFTWRHLNFFQHHCYLMARLPRLSCPGGHGIRRVEAPWAREGIRFTLLVRTGCHEPRSRDAGQCRRASRWGNGYPLVAHCSPPCVQGHRCAEPQGTQDHRSG